MIAFAFSFFDNSIGLTRGSLHFDGFNPPARMQREIENRAAQCHTQEH
jgi:hypothetical protein